VLSGLGRPAFAKNNQGSDDKVPQIDEPVHKAHEGQKGQDQDVGKQIELDNKVIHAHAICPFDFLAPCSIVPCSVTVLMSLISEPPRSIPCPTHTCARAHVHTEGEGFDVVVD